MGRVVLVWKYGVKQRGPVGRYSKDRGSVFHNDVRIYL